MQENGFLDPGTGSKMRGVTLFERINRLSVMRELAPNSKIMNLEKCTLSPRDPLKKDTIPKIKENPNFPDSLINNKPDRASFPLKDSIKKEDLFLKVIPPDENPKEDVINLQELNEHYDLGNQNYFTNKIRKSIKQTEKLEKIEKGENVAKKDEIDLDFTIQTRKRKRSLVYSRHGIKELVILSSRREMESSNIIIPPVALQAGLSHISSSSNSELYKSDVLKIGWRGMCTHLFMKIKSFIIHLGQMMGRVKNETQNSFTKVLMAKEDLREIDLSTQKSKYVLLPTSFFQRNWDLILLLSIFYEFILIPLKIAFHLEKDSVFITFFDALVFLISCIDILVNFKTGYINSRGVLELNPGKIYTRYKSTYLPYDLISTFPLSLMFQIYILCVPNSSFLNDTTDSFDYLQLILLYKVFRCSRLNRILRRFDENTLYNPAIVRITISTFRLVFLWHWIACFYWFISVSEGFSSNAWTPDPSFLYRAIGSQYNYSLLWAVTVTVGVGVNISPYTNVELIYSSFVIVIGVALYGILLGSTSSAFLSIDDQDADFRNQLDSLNNFMRKKKVSFDLQKRIEENLKYLWSSQQTLNVSNQWFLEGVHSLLKLELCINLNKQYLDKIPMFQNISFDCLVFLLNLLESRIYLPEEYVICEGSYSQNLYFIQTGILEVIDQKNCTRVRLYDGDFFGEQSLFVLKKKTADVKCLTYSELLIISKEALGQIIRKFPDFSLNLFNYLKNKDADQIKKNAITKKYWFLVSHAYEIAKFLKREDQSLRFEDLFYQKKKIFVKEDKEEIKKKVVEAFKKTITSA